MPIMLSIITINYNNAPGLQKTMESVFAQTSQEFEYIVVDGDSTDESKEIIKQSERDIDKAVSSTRRLTGATSKSFSKSLRWSLALERPTCLAAK